MGKCVLCDQETTNKATVYVGSPTYHANTEHTTFAYQPQTEYFCDTCVQQHISHNFSGMMFYLALQLCWFTVAKYGLFSPFGMLGAAIALLGIWRLLVLLARRLHQRYRSEQPMPRLLYREEDDESEASDLFKTTIKKSEEAQGRRVLSLREYRRTHGK